jgi:hypothetical protein
MLDNTLGTDKYHIPAAYLLDNLLCRLARDELTRFCAHSLLNSACGQYYVAIPYSFVPVDGLTLEGGEPVWYLKPATSIFASDKS